MKKLIVLVLAIVTLSACSSGKVSEEKVAQVQPGITIEMVEDILDKPKNVISDNEKVSKNAQDEYQTMDNLNSKMQDDQLETKMAQLNYVFDASENGENVKEYVYQTDERDIQIYFVDDVVEYINFMMD